MENTEEPCIICFEENKEKIFFDCNHSICLVCYSKILQKIREKYIYNCRYTYDLTRRQFRQYYNAHFKYTILYENHKKVCNNIKRYNTKKNIIKIRNCN